MNCPGNFLNQKIWNLVGDTDFNKNFHFQPKGRPLFKTAFIFVKLCLLFTEKIFNFECLIFSRYLNIDIGANYIFFWRLNYQHVSSL